jgi:alpha-L-rhamnosidase
MKRLLPGLFLLLQASFGNAKPIAANAIWPAEWIAVPDAPAQDYGVYYFRKTFNLQVKPEHLKVYVSGDNRYQLFVNGVRVSWGPARGDLTHWRYETVDLAPQLQNGKNLLAAVVWNEGQYRAVAQVTNRTGFLLQAADSENAVVNTDRSWKCMADSSYTPRPLPPEQATGYYALAANERLDGRLHPWGWELGSFPDSGWNAAGEISHGAPRDAQDAPNRWMLVERKIPLEEQRLERMPAMRKAEGIRADDGFLKGRSPLAVPARTSVKLLLDQSYLTTAYPELEVSGGRDTTIDLRYAETLYVSKGPHGDPVVKGNRNEVEAKQFFGPADTFIADGGPHRVYRPLYWRTYRYIELQIKTGDEPLTLEDFHGIFTAYPFQRQADFEVTHGQANEELQKILNTGWRTARLCAHETYMDCPFYEQLQYGGDARIQMLVSLYMTGDSRLMKNGIALLNSSRTAEGATYSRAPSYLQQYIPPFSLWWIGMVHDYWMYVDDPEFVKQMMPGVHAVLEFYSQYQKETGSLEKMPWWNFVDWVKQWSSGVPPANADGSSAAALDLQLLLAYQWAADLERAFGSRSRSAEYEGAAQLLKATVASMDWDPRAGLFADQPEHRTYSQQVNTLAVLAHLVPQRQERRVVEKLIGNQGPGSAATELAPSSVYFRAYTNATLREAGLGGRYLEMLGPWRQMLADGLTTWAEWNGPDSRSDCHAWGASPNFELLRTVAGIESMAPGFRRVRIAPNLGQFKEVSARMPHPRGAIAVKLHLDTALSADIDLPEGTDGEFEWAGASHALLAGPNHLKLPVNK